MKQLTRSLALLLTLVLTFGCLLPSASMAEGQAPAWNGIPATSFAGGSGTESDPYLISNGAELAYLAQKVNEDNTTQNPYRSAWYKLTADIDLGNQEWTPIGWNSSTSYYFCGTFIGGGHTISHLKISGSQNNVGLFGNLAAANICDFTIRDSSIQGGHYVGAFAGSTGASPSPIVKLCNLHVVDSTVKGVYGVGGILGFANVGSSNTMTLCCSSIQGGTVSASQYAVGGLIGHVYAAKVTIQRSWCEADGIRSSSYGGAGGIVGMAADPYGSTTSQANIADCYNTAPVSVGSPYNGAQYYNAAGGILGYSKGAGTTVERCYNAGAITAGSSMSKNISYAAGICGYSMGGAYTNCYQAGSVATTNTNTSSKPTLSGIRCNSGTVNYCYYTADTFTSNSQYFTKSTSGTEIADVAAIVTRISQDAAWTGTGYWKLSDSDLPTLTGCIGPDGTCTCGCGCHCAPKEEEPVSLTVEYQYPAGTTYEVLSVQEGDTTTTYGPETFYTGKYDETNGWVLTGWYDQAGNAYGLHQEITVTQSLVLTPKYTEVLLLCDGNTGTVLQVLRAEDYTSGRNDLLAGGLDYTGTDIQVKGTGKSTADGEYTFAGWFFQPSGNQAGHALDWTAENNVGAADLFHCDQVQNHRIYAYWIDAGYSQAKIAYRADAKSAREVYINSTVPDDLFQAYGFVVSTKAKPEDESRLIIGGTIDGKPVGNYEKTTVYETFKAAPIYERDYTAKDFNGGLPGYNNQGAGDGYITYFYWMYMQLKDANGNFTTLSARAYYRTLEGTLVYGDMSQVTFSANTICSPLA